MDFYCYLISIFSCPGHPLITAFANVFTVLVDYVYIIIIYYSKWSHLIFLDIFVISVKMIVGIFFLFKLKREFLGLLFS